MLLQVMTFDGDATGLAVAESLQAALRRGVSVCVVVDSFALQTISDRPARAVPLEAAATRDMLRGLREAGATVVRTQPYGLFGQWSLARNHKKLFVVEDRLYLGGVNLSDHNAAWHDFMIEIDDPTVVAQAVADIEATVCGRRRRIDGPLLTNPALETRFDELVANARDEVVVCSPYAIDVALVTKLGSCSANRRVVVVAAENNFALYRLMGPYLMDRLRGLGVEVVAYPSFSHAKFLAVDRSVLLVGSANYGRHSFRCNEEVGFVIDDAETVEPFCAEMLGELQPADLAPPNVARLLTGGLIAHGFDAAVRFYGAAFAHRAPALASSLVPHGRSRSGPSHTPNSVADRTTNPA